MLTRVLASLALAAGLALSPLAAQATIVFDFYWSGEVGVNGATASDDQSLLGTGYMEIDAAAGETFDQTDVVDMLISFSGLSISSFSITEADTLVFEGVIAGSGATASLFDFPAPSMISGTNFFGCAASGCGSTTFQVLVSNAIGDDYFVDYASSTAAAASMTLTAAPVPVPATLPLAAAGLAALAFVARRRAA
ncbi:hypothetical protein P2H44_03090 [Albimonas sp. CAU 1670]|uniref:PEP-CTERM sorting domain-containing protein n=1 Tax=Albimonas sp. CAU 1670 TaxID=3032599 RepID=UPI0023DB0F22|nr:PEP-CTERM sorting domain-containing protein [Albimonas sp. CAU 1670]MDF2231530.1 hypothetical protein [Albimonas sp. CAU 1670]